MSNAQPLAAVPLPERLQMLLPGIVLAGALGLSAAALQGLEEQLVGHAIIEGLVLAIILGTIWRNLRGLAPAVRPGVKFTSSTVLEVAIVMLGASVDIPALLKPGPALLVAIVAAVGASLVASTLIARKIGLNPKLAILVACGNSICGNSAIAAIAPIIQADAEDVASSIGLTAALGVLVVVTLPLLIPLLHFSFYQYGVLAGMTVYAVPQVLAATFPVSAVSGQVGTLVKLARVLMLGPVALFFSLRRSVSQDGPRLPLSRMVPWFIMGFLALGTLRSLGLLPLAFVDPLREGSRWLTIAAMAALGLNVDIGAVRKVGLPVAGAVLASLVVLLTISVTLIRTLGIQ
jgi:uncharacterized integral membrane protein (TIGR00698 family)